MKRKDRKKPRTLSMQDSLWRKIQKEADKIGVSASELVCIFAQVGLHKLKSKKKLNEEEVLERLAG